MDTTPDTGTRNSDWNRLWTVREVADLLGMDESAVYRWAQAGLLRTVRLARLLRIPGAEVRRLASEGVPVADVRRGLARLAQRRRTARPAAPEAAGLEP